MRTDISMGNHGSIEMSGILSFCGPKKPSLLFQCQRKEKLGLGALTSITTPRCTGSASEGTPILALLETRSTVTPHPPLKIPEGAKLCGPLPITCVHRDRSEVPAASITVEDCWGKHTITAGIVPNLPVPLLLGQNLLGICGKTPLGKRGK